MRILFCTALIMFLASCGNNDNNQAQGDSAASQQVYKWKLVTSWPKNYPGLGTAPENFADRVEAMSNGRLQIKVFGAGQLVPALQ
ncbi:MAG: ABC transporter substrate-binding protein, partial [Porticoccaceae bacterium]